MFDLSSEITSNFEEACTLYEMPHGLCLFISHRLLPKKDFSFVTFQLSFKVSNVSRLPLTRSVLSKTFLSIECCMCGSDQHPSSQQNVVSVILTQQIKSSITLIINFCYTVILKCNGLEQQPFIQLTILQVNNFGYVQLGSSGLGQVQSILSAISCRVSQEPVGLGYPQLGQLSRLVHTAIMESLKRAEGRYKLGTGTSLFLSYSIGQSKF